jgi:hypothetical protein
VTFPARSDLLIHRLGGLDLREAQRVSFVLSVESSGKVLIALEQAGFDRERGEVLLACQRHYAFLPPDTVAEVRVHRPDRPDDTARYTILHRFEQT